MWVLLFLCNNFVKFLRVCPFIAYENDEWCFPAKFAKFLRTSFFFRTHPVAASRNISWILSLLHMRTMNGAISWYVLAVQRLFHFIACVSLLCISFCFLFFFVDSTTCLGFEVSSSILKIKQCSCS